MTRRIQAEEARLVEKYAEPVPRYTSYPTAPHFHDGVDADNCRAWLEALPPAATLSVYVHVPFCDTLCWFCGCHTKITRRYDPVAAYLPALEAEMEHVHGLVPDGTTVTSIHWGGGSPTMLAPHDIERLADALRERVAIAPEAEFAVEIDPRGLTPETVAALARAGVTRASIGVQDFDPKVQAAINRVQSFEETERVVDGLRAAGIGSINIDIMYGLPHQTEDAVLHTVDQVAALAPDRVALFGYAHVPWMKRHQSLIDEAALPGLVQRFRQSQAAAARLEEAGFCPIGLDHFAQPYDALARTARAGSLKRNFQGYTTDAADALIGLGASAISCLPQGYCQNETPIARYRNRVTRGGLATARGIRLEPEDVARRWVIERLMCDFAFSCTALGERFPASADSILEDISELALLERDGLIAWTEDGFIVTDTGRPFVRVVAARFDAFLTRARARHSVAV